MGMRSAEGVPGTRSPLGLLSLGSLRAAPMLILAAAAQAAEAVGLCVAVILNVIYSASGDASTASDGAAFIGLEVIVAVAVAWVAWGIVRVRPWSRTPAVLTQVFTLLIAVWLLQAHRYGWGIPALLLAIAALAGLFAPTSLRALTRTMDRPETPSR